MGGLSTRCCERLMRRRKTSTILFQSGAPYRNGWMERIGRSVEIEPRFVERLPSGSRTIPNRTLLIIQAILFDVRIWGVAAHDSIESAQIGSGSSASELPFGR